MTSRRRIAVFDQYPFLGGGQVVLLSVVQAALDVCGSVTVVAPRGGGLESALLEQFGSRITLQDVRLPDLTHGRKGVWDILRLAWCTLVILPACLGVARRSDLLYANGPRLFPAVLVASMLARCSCCYHVHINFGFLERALLVAASKLPLTWKVVVNSDETYRQLARAAPALERSGKLLLIENSLSPRYRGCRYINRFEIRPQVWSIGVFGVLRPEKGQDLAVELARRIPGVRVHVVGRIGEGAEQWVTELRAGAPDNVEFHEAVPDVLRFIDENKIHFNLVPSRWAEPFGLVAIEGMAASCLTVVSRAGALPRIAERTGALSFDGSVDDLTRVVTGLLQESLDVVTLLARGQHDRTMESYSADRMLMGLAALLRGGLRS